MRKKKQQNAAPAETDFFAEALKAFEVPSSPAEQPPAQEKEETAAKPPKLKYLRKWWPAILSIIVCAVLLVSFWPKPQRDSYRGEHWIYGSVMDHGDDYMVLLDAQGQGWYVDIAGLEVPEWKSETYSLLEDRWVFYDGEPKACDLQGCTKKVTATLVLDNNSGLLEGLEEYGLVYDEATADLNGDGISERWLLCHGPTSGVSSLRVVGLDAQGNRAYDVSVLTPRHSTYLLQCEGEKLQIISPYSTFDVRLADGALRVYDGSEMLVVLDDYAFETTPPTEIGGEAMIKFSLITADLPVITLAQSNWKTVSEEDANALKDSLVALEWKSNTGETICTGTINFSLGMDGERNDYDLLPDGTILWNDQVATVTKEIWETLVLLMGCDASIEKKYEGYPGEDAEMQLNFDRENATVDIFYQTADGARMMRANFGAIGNYLYLFSATRSVENSLILVFRIHEDGTLELCSDLCKAEYLELPDELVLLPESMPITAQPKQVSFRLTSQPLQNGEQIGTGYHGWVLMDVEKETFYKILSGLQWIEGGDYTPLGTMQVLFEDDSIKEYSLLDGGMLAIGNKHAILGVDSRVFIMDLMIQASTMVDYATGAYSAGEGISLLLNESNTFELNYGGIVYAGTYIQIGRVLYLSTTEGASLLFVEHSDGTLEYVDNGYGYMLPNGLRFVLSAEAT